MDLISRLHCNSRWEGGLAIAPRGYDYVCKMPWKAARLTLLNGSWKLLRLRDKSFFFVFLSFLHCHAYCVQEEVRDIMRAPLKTLLASQTTPQGPSWVFIAKKPFLGEEMCLGGLVKFSLCGWLTIEVRRHNGFLGLSLNDRTIVVCPSDLF